LACEDSDLQWGATALINAALCNKINCARLLIDAGADKDAKNYVRRQSLLSREAFSQGHLY
jgi:hypothetical protein